jgi:2-dehydro-3-deoxyphosphogluconate aldolase/(4S)-4-hydroxy-2-oxoglutarate aldolase
MMAQLNVEPVFTAGPIIPVMVIEHLEDALPLGQALFDGGLTVFEITLRTPCALEALHRLANAFPQVKVGAGTVLNTAQYDDAVAAGASFVISPGLTTALLEHAAHKPVPLIPGVANASNMMQALEAGYSHLKFFPAEINGGAKALKALTAPISQVTVCPTGGVTADNLKDYLALDCVSCVGGTWMLPADMIHQRDWTAITELTRVALEQCR